MATSNELNISAVTQVLKLLSNLRPDVLVTRIDISKVALERVDLIKGEVSLAERLDAFHHIKQPAAGFERLVPEEQCLLPLLKNRILRPNETAPDDMNLAGLGHAIQSDF